MVWKSTACTLCWCIVIFSLIRAVLQIFPSSSSSLESSREPFELHCMQRFALQILDELQFNRKLLFEMKKFDSEINLNFSRGTIERASGGWNVMKVAKR